MVNQQITKGDIKGDLAQRLECATCTRKLNQVEDFEIVKLDKKESAAPDAKRAVTIMCDECIKLKRVPMRAYRYVMADIINEVQTESLPDYAEKEDIAGAGEDTGAFKKGKK
jgi:RNase P subunit RPR2